MKINSKNKSNHKKDNKNPNNDNDHTMSEIDEMRKLVRKHHEEKRRIVKREPINEKNLTTVTARTISLGSVRSPSHPMGRRARPLPRRMELSTMADCIPG